MVAFVFGGLFLSTGLSSSAHVFLPPARNLQLRDVAGAGRSEPPESAAPPVQIGLSSKVLPLPKKKKKKEGKHQGRRSARRTNRAPGNAVPAERRPRRATGIRRISAAGLHRHRADDDSRPLEATGEISALYKTAF